MKHKRLLRRCSQRHGIIVLGHEAPRRVPNTNALSGKLEQQLAPPTGSYENSVQHRRCAKGRLPATCLANIAATNVWLTQPVIIGPLVTLTWPLTV
jgi:hypothetical protein